MSLFDNPNEWVASIVSTWLRFWVFAIMLTGILIYTVDLAVSSGWHAVWGPVIFIAGYQLMILYALRQQYRRLPGEEVQ